MSTITGIIQRTAGESLWGWPAPSIELAADQAVFFLRRRDCALVRVALSGTDAATVRSEPGCEALVVARDLGIRLHLPCEFAAAAPGDIEAEVRLRLLDNAAEWPRRLPQMPATASLDAAGGQEQALGRLVAALFEAEMLALAAQHSHADFRRRLNDPAMIAEAEDGLRRALGRWTEEGIVSLLAVHLLGARSQASVALRQSEREHALQVLRARQANELAALERERRLAAPDEVRWRLFEPRYLLPAGAPPPRMVKESSAPYEALVSGQHLQLVVRPESAGHVHVLALGPYRTAAGSEYRWMRLFGNEGRSDLVDRAARPGGNRLEAGETLLFPGDAGAAALFQHYLTIDTAPGWETLVVALTPEPLPEASLEANLPPPPRIGQDFRTLQSELNGGLQRLFGAGARIYLFQFFHS